ncbi:MAG: DUF1579 domain-containing protein [Chitinophagaceae bacterium]|nr:DUF1579 domain-containing protein [Chitinophagaceae bacterium]
MKKLIPALAIFAITVSSCNNDAATKKETPVDSGLVATLDSPVKSSAVLDTAAIAKAWNDFKVPSTKHQLIRSWDGTWTGEVSQWMDPGSRPMVSRATMVSKTAANGLFQESKWTGSMFGAPFEGKSLLGFDNGKKKFVSTWIDNSSSGIVFMTGDWDENSKTLSLSGNQTDPVTGKDTEIRQVLKIVDSNTQILTMYGAGMDGKEMKFMEGTFSRRK